MKRDYLRIRGETYHLNDRTGLLRNVFDPTDVYHRTQTQCGIIRDDTGKPVALEVLHRFQHALSADEIIVDCSEEW